MADVDDRPPRDDGRDGRSAPRDDDHDRRRDRYDDDRKDYDRRERDRGSGRDRHRSREDYDDRRRHRDDYDDRHKGRHSRGRSRSRSRSRSRDRRGRKGSGFDMAPPAVAAPPTAGADAGGAVYPFGQFPGFPQIPVAAMTQQATRHARRVYVGGLPPMANEQSVATFFSQAMHLIGGNTAGPGDCVVNVYINQEKKFAFVELRTVEETSNAMALDGVNFDGVAVRVRRPSDYNPSMAATLGPSQPNPNLNLAAVGLTPGSGAGGADGPDRVFVGGLPYYLTEEQIKELLSSFGPLKGFDLIKDRETGSNKGYGFCVWQNPAVTDIACAALNGMKLGDKTLTVRRATSSGQAKPDQTAVLQQAQQQIAMQLGGLVSPGLAGTGANNIPLGMPAEVPTKVLVLLSVVTPDELVNDQDYEEIFEDMKEECAKYGSLVKVVIPRPDPSGAPRPGVGKVFVEYADTTSSAKAKQALHGRKFGGNAVVATYYREEKFHSGDYSG